MKVGRPSFAKDNNPPGMWFAPLQVLGDKMNLTVRLGKQFSGSSPCLPRQLGTGQQGCYTSGTLINSLPNLTVRFILSPSMHAG